MAREQSDEHPAAVKIKAGALQKMKIKKSRSFKLCNSESFKSRKEHLRWKKHSARESISSTQKKPSPVRKFNGSSPNYMKPTSSSDAKKESLQVSPKSQTPTRCRSPKDVISVSSNKSPKTWKRTSSLKPVRLSMKKSSNITLYPKLNMGRATCSSTLKDSKFPAHLDLHPGGSEMDRISVMKVCPYTYCSLNGHQHHEPLPPLKRFLSLRRRLLRAQKSMKLKGISATDIDYIGQDKREMDTGQSDSLSYLDVASAGSKFSPTLEDTMTDFFIHIYEKSMKETTETKSEPRHVSNATPLYPDEETVIPHEEIELWLSELSDAQKEDGAAVERQTHEPETNAGLKGNIHQVNSSNAVTDISTPDNLDECNEKSKEEETQRLLQLAKTNSTKVASDCCIEGGINLEKTSDSRNEDPVQELVCNPVDIDIQNWYVEETENYPLKIINGYCKNSTGNIFVDALQSPENNQPITEAPKGQEEGIGAKNGEKTESNPEVATETNVDAREDTLYEDVQCKNQHVNTKNNNTGQNEAQEMVGGHAHKSLFRIEFSDYEGRPGMNFDTTHENQCVVESTQMKTKDVSNLVGKQFSSEKDQTTPKGVGAINSGFTINHSGSISKGNQFCTIQGDTGEDELKKTDIIVKDPVNHLAPVAREVSPKPQPTKEVCKRTAKHTIEKDLGQMKEFNPRGPHFLPQEPGPETEKVDLRHQLMDDRRSPEEWMLDYALRQAVNKLNPAQKRRVALLVEAFENVMPVPKCENQLLRDCFSCQTNSSLQLATIKEEKSLLQAGRPHAGNPEI